MARRFVVPWEICFRNRTMSFWLPLRQASFISPWILFWYVAMSEFDRQIGQIWFTKTFTYKKIIIKRKIKIKYKKNLQKYKIHTFMWCFSWTKINIWVHFIIFLFIYFVFLSSEVFCNIYVNLFVIVIFSCITSIGFFIFS